MLVASQEGIFMNAKALTRRIKLRALELGFSKVGVTTADDFAEFAADLSSRESYSARWCGPKGTNSLLAGCYPKDLYPEGKGIICAALGFSDIDFPENLTRHIGRVYLARSYTPTLEQLAGVRVKAFKDYLNSLGITVYEGPEEIPARAVGLRSGVTAWGRNNFARTEEDGTFVALYTFLVDAELIPDEPTDMTLPENKCPDNCRLCIDACPMHAMDEEGRLTWTKCVLFNNLRGCANVDLREAVGERIHGCDVCQLVCPRNREVLAKPKRRDPFLDELSAAFDLEDLLLLSEETYESAVRPVMYNYIRDREIFKRNAAVALGNSGDMGKLAVLRDALELTEDEITREAIEWAIARLDSGRRSSL